jgi:hypothetical protein
VEHLDCLWGRWIVCEILAEFRGYSARLQIMGIDLKEPGQRASLLGRWNPMAKLNLAEVSLVHLCGRRHHAQRHPFLIAHTPQQFAKR